MNCRICHQPLEALTRVPVCPDCWLQVAGYEDRECAQCGMFLMGPAVLHGTSLCGFCRRGSFSFEQARSFGWYEGVLAGLIQRLKYDGMVPLAPPLAEYLYRAMQRLDERDWDMVLPVPLHRNREKNRGFNQAALLAETVSRQSGIPLGGRDCVRVKDTRPQTGLRSTERRRNVAGAFAVPDPGKIRGLKVLLVDDVLTTGATMNACAQALLTAGAGSVSALTLARARPGLRDVI